MPHFVRAIVCLISLLLLAEIASAQRSRKSTARKFNAGDEIEYLWGSKWYPGTVVEADTSGVAIEYMWGSSQKREKVDSFKLRFAWEAKAITPMRFWSDETKQFRIRAAAIGIKDGNVKLHKEDGTELNVPIDKLCSADQRVLKKFEAKAGPPIAEIPELTKFNQQSSGFAASWNNATDLSGLEPDPPPSFASVPMKGVGFRKAHFFENLIRVEPIGGGTDGSWPERLTATESCPVAYCGHR